MRQIVSTGPSGARIVKLPPNDVVPLGWSQQVLADAPLVWWRMDDSSGTTCTDSSGNARNGTYANSPTLAQASLLPLDSASKSVDFNGSNQYASIASASWMNVTTITLEALIRPDNVVGSGHMVADRDPESGGRSFQFRLNGDKIEFIAFVGGVVKTATGATAMVVGNTYLVHGTYDGSNVRVYLNGVQDGILAAAGTLSSSTEVLGVGAHGHGTASYFDGRIDEFAMYGTALSATRIASHFSVTGL